MSDTLPPSSVASMQQAPQIKSEPIVQTTEIQPESSEEQSQDGKDWTEGEASDIEAPADGQIKIMKHMKRRPKKPQKPVDPPVKIPIHPNLPVNILPYPDAPVTTLPVPDHPIFVPNATIIQNVETHVLCNDWFVQNVRELVEEYKKLRADNIRQATMISGLNREVADLRLKLKGMTQERDEWKADYENEVLQHSATRAELNAVRGVLAELRIRYSKVLCDLKQVKAQLSDAIREVNRLKVDVANKADRIRDLEEKLRISNESEDAANARVVDLQRSIYELEKEKTLIERRKDREEHTARVARDRILELEGVIAELQTETRHLKKKHYDTDAPIYHTYGQEAEAAAPSVPETYTATAVVAEAAPAAPAEETEHSSPADEE